MTSPRMTSPRTRAHLSALTAAVLPAVVVSVLAFAAAALADDTGCEGFSCPSLGYGLIGVFAIVTAPVVAVLGQLATAGLGAAVPALRTHPVGLGLLGAVVGWVGVIAYLARF